MIPNLLIAFLLGGMFIGTQVYVRWIDPSPLVADDPDPWIRLDATERPER